MSLLVSQLNRAEEYQSMVATLAESIGCSKAMSSGTALAVLIALSVLQGERGKIRGTHKEAIHQEAIHVLNFIQDVGTTINNKVKDSSFM